jgi:hypothetical protein
MATRRMHAQAYVELRSGDPEAESVLAVARRRLAAAKGLQGLRRFRLFELSGAKLDPRALEERLHGSIQFYNPAKERCLVRARAEDPSPAPGEVLVLVFERNGERREAAERWWRHDSGERVDVREGVVWALHFEPGTDAEASARELAVAVDRTRGLFANPHFQESRVCVDGAPPLDWMTRKVARSSKRRGRGIP